MFSCFITHHPAGIFVLTGSEDNSVNIYALNSEKVSLEGALNVWKIMPIYSEVTFLVGRFKTQKDK